MCALLQTTKVVDGSTTFLGFGINTLGDTSVGSALAPIFDPAKSTMMKEYMFPQAPDAGTFLIPAYASGDHCTETQKSYTRTISAATRTETQEKNSVDIGFGKPGFIGGFDGSFTAASRIQNYFYCYYLDYTVTGTICVSTSPESDPFLSDAFISDVNMLPATFDRANPSNVTAWFNFFQKYGGYYVSDLIYGGVFQYFNAVTTVEDLPRDQININFGSNIEGINTGISAGITDTYQTYKRNSTFEYSTIGGKIFLSSIDPRAVETDAGAMKVFNAIKAWKKTIPMDPNEQTDIRVKAIADLPFVTSRGLGGAMSAAFDYYFLLHSPTIRVELQQSAIQLAVIGSSQPPLSNNKPIITIAESNVNDLKTPDTQMLPPQCAPFNMGFQVVILDSATIPAAESVLWNKYYPFNFLASSPLCIKGTEEFTQPFFNKVDIDNLNLYGDFVDDFSNSANNLNIPDNLFIFSTYNMPTSFFPDFNMNAILLGNGASTRGDAYTSGTVGTYQNWVNSPREEGAQTGTNIILLNINKPSTYTLIGRITSSDTGAEVFGAFDPTQSLAMNSILEVNIYKRAIDDLRPAIALNQATVTTTPIPPNIL
ncbi:MAC/Perforin domain-containing protein [Marininema mesophilum]|uniref:MAC/Perforin domain-containing protein n=1 Tax=Marininema mesophilum TaxID=1048340 RepID=A0A1H3CZL2_9BACL|nr:MAC/perforin domain-containing protein [Marininema mesophilum]SDX59470.1 MAC/Perforin domain-containing protein [Marininema mesophilum]